MSPVEPKDIKDFITQEKHFIFNLFALNVLYNKLIREGQELIVTIKILRSNEIEKESLGSRILEVQLLTVSLKYFLLFECFLSHFFL